ncbi:MAG TPA: 20S proteasome subunit A/B [Armatimonadota bacterium]|jgi:proteasome alpha subunit
MVTPYDFNESVQHRAEYVEERLRDGSPVVGMKYRDGLLLLSMKRTQRKVFEVYDRLMMSAIGNQADIEAVRIAALDFAHQEGFSRSPDDVTVNRIVGFALSPPLKKAFGDAWASPVVFRGVFAELAGAGSPDRFATLNYDGEFAFSEDFAVAAGSSYAEEAMVERLREAKADVPLDEAIRAAVEAWALGHRAGSQPRALKAEDDDAGEPPVPLDEYIQTQMKDLVVEAAVLDRQIARDAKFRLLQEVDWKDALK